MFPSTDQDASRCVSIVRLVTLHGRASLSVSTSVLTVQVCTGTWACTLVLSGVQILFAFGQLELIFCVHSSTNLDSWQLSQLRTMKVGGNASATDFFNRHGGGSLLINSDTKAKYTSRFAELYKEELAKRVKEDTAK